MTIWWFTEEIDYKGEIITFDEVIDWGIEKGLVPMLMVDYGDDRGEDYIAEGTRFIERLSEETLDQYLNERSGQNL